MPSHKKKKVRTFFFQHFFMRKKGMLWYSQLQHRPTLMCTCIVRGQSSYNKLVATLPRYYNMVGSGGS